MKGELSSGLNERDEYADVNSFMTVTDFVVSVAGKSAVKSKKRLIALLQDLAVMRSPNKLRRLVGNDFVWMFRRSYMEKLSREVFEELTEAKRLGKF
jgi:hypothetical protein